MAKILGGPFAPPPLGVDVSIYTLGMLGLNFVIALNAGIPRDSHNFNGLRHILTDSGLTPQILTDNGLGRGGQ